MSTIATLDAANLFCGDDNPENSLHLKLADIKLPNLEEKMETHHAGGSRVEMKFAVGIQAFMCTFKILGWDPIILAQFGVSDVARRPYTMYGAVKDKRSAKTLEVKAVMEGRLVKAEAENYTRGSNLMHHDHVIDEISNYQLYYDGTELIYWDFFTTVWRVNGKDQNSAERNILRIPGG